MLMAIAVVMMLKMAIMVVVTAVKKHQQMRTVFLNSLFLNSCIE
jgi:hypothetical protein